MRHLRLVILLLAAAFALALLGTRALFIRQDEMAAIQRGQAASEDLARIVELYARGTFAIADLASSEVAAMVRRRGGLAGLRDDPAGWRRLREIAERAQQDYILVVDAAGIPVAVNFSATAPVNQDFSDRAWFRAHLAGAETHVGDALHSRITGEVLFTFTRAIRTEAGGLEGVVQIAIRPRFFQDASLTADTGRQAVLALWSADGPVVARTALPTGGIGHHFSEPDRLRQAMRDGQSSYRQVSAVDGIDRLVTLRRVPGWPVVAAASVPVSSGLAGPAASDTWSGRILLASLLGFALLTVVALRLVGRVEQARTALAGANAALERHVAARTAELAQANTQLAQNEERYRGIFNSTFQFTGLLDPAGTLLEANETALRFAGVTAADVVGRPFWDTPWWRPDKATQEQLQDAIRRAAKGEFVRYEVTVTGAGAGQAEAILDFSLKPVRDADGHVVWLMPEGRDITQLKAAQAQLHEAQKLETLGQLTGGVAHDFNNLLMVILGNLSLLRKRLPADDARAQRLVDGATQGAERGAALTRRLLAFARRQELRPEPIDLGKLVQGMEDLLRRTVGPLCRITVAIPPNLREARGDVNQVELALLNLAVNARDAMPLGGDLTITAREGLAGAAEGLAPGRYLCLGVTDSGTGMDAATLARATEPFFTTKGPGKGSGLGLSMVHGLAVQSGGQLRISSEPGCGTTVTLWLPAHDPGSDAKGGAEAVPAPRVAGRPLAVLLVDDDPLVQAGTQAMLEDLGHRVTLAGSGAEAEELIKSGTGFDLMITDYAMPGMDGLELARRAAQLRPLLPVVLATGFAELGAQVETTLPRLDKPYRQEALAALIGRVVEDRPANNVVRLPLPPRN